MDQNRGADHLPTGCHRRWTVLAEVGRLDEPTLIRRAADEICKHELKCDEALGWLRDRRRQLKAHVAENGKDGGGTESSWMNAARVSLVFRTKSAPR